MEKTAERNERENIKAGRKGNERKWVRNELDRIGGKYSRKRIQKMLKKERKVEKE